VSEDYAICVSHRDLKFGVHLYVIVAMTISLCQAVLFRSANELLLLQDMRLVSVKW